MTADFDKKMHASRTSLSLLHLLHASSPSLPIGAFAYSQGLEYSLDAQWCKTANDVECWISTILEHGLGGVDLPVALRLHRGWSASDKEQTRYWNQMLLSFRESKELYLEDVQVGAAFLQWHRHQSAEQVDTQLEWLDTPGYAAMFTLHSVLNGIDAQDCLLGYAWAWLDNQIAAASKAMPMGQTDGQRIIKHLLPVIEHTLDRAKQLSDDELGSNLPGLAMASALHEHQYSRLFRS